MAHPAEVTVLTDIGRSTALLRITELYVNHASRM